MDREKLRKLYQEKLYELELEREKLGEMFAEREEVNKPLTDETILEQNRHCGEISLEITKLKEMMEKAGD